METYERSEISPLVKLIKDIARGKAASKVYNRNIIHPDLKILKQYHLVA